LANCLGIEGYCLGLEDIALEGYFLGLGLEDCCLGLGLEGYCLGLITAKKTFKKWCYTIHIFKKAEPTTVDA
jgi:hypothetical protein